MPIITTYAATNRSAAEMARPVEPGSWRERARNLAAARQAEIRGSLPHIGGTPAVALYMLGAAPLALTALRDHTRSGPAPARGVLNAHLYSFRSR